MADYPTRDVRAEGKRAMRTALLEIASELLEREGADALSMRRIAKLAGCSTSVLYTQFGGKEGLAAALYREGFERLDAALQTVLQKVDASDPLEKVRQLNHTYRQTALANPTHYAVMFGRPIPEFEPTPELREQAQGSLRHLVQSLEACVGAGKLEGEPSEMAKKLWALTHGLVSVELAGHLEDEQGVYEMLEATMQDLFTAWSNK